MTGGVEEVSMSKSKICTFETAEGAGGYGIVTSSG